MEVPVHNRKGEIVTQALVDAEDYDIISQFKWNLSKDGYAVCKISGGKTIKMHEMVIAINGGLTRKN